MFLRVFIFISVLFSADAIAVVGKGHVSGKITNITSISPGLLVRINANEVPEHFTSGRVWMLIKQENKKQKQGPKTGSGLSSCLFVGCG